MGHLQLTSVCMRTKQEAVEDEDYVICQLIMQTVCGGSALWPTWLIGLLPVTDLVLLLHKLPIQSLSHSSIASETFRQRTRPPQTQHFATATHQSADPFDDIWVASFTIGDHTVTRLTSTHCHHVMLLCDNLFSLCYVCFLAAPFVPSSPSGRSLLENQLHFVFLAVLKSLRQIISTVQGLLSLDCLFNRLLLSHTANEPSFRVDRVNKELCRSKKRSTLFSFSLRLQTFQNTLARKIRNGRSFDKCAFLKI